MIFAAIDPVQAFAGLDEASGVLTDILGHFTAAIKNGGEKVVQAEASFAGALIAMQYLRLIVTVGISRKVTADVIFTFIMGLIWYQIAVNAVAIVASWTVWCSNAAAWFSGGAIEGDVMNNPSVFSALALDAFAKMIDQALGFTNPFTAGAALLAYFVLGLFLLLSFFLLGFLVVYIVVRSSLEMIIGMMLIPFVIEHELRFIAARGIGMIIDAGTKLAASSAAIGVSYGVLKNWKLPADPTMRHGVNLFAGALVCAIVCGGATLVKGVAAAMRR